MSGLPCRLSLRSRPFSQTLFVFIVALIVLVVVGITLVDYSIAERNLRDHQRLLEEQTEIDLNNSIMLIDEGLKLFDDTMNGEMERGLVQFIDEYERAGRDPSAMDLTRIKHDIFHDEMDLYVINASNMIEFTTYPPDQDLDFSTEADFAEYLSGIRNTSGFYPDRVVREPGSGILRKYAYAPTSDHRYILELGMIGDKFKSERRRLHVHGDDQGHQGPEPLRRGRPALHPVQEPGRQQFLQTRRPAQGPARPGDRRTRPASTGSVRRRATRYGTSTSTSTTRTTARISRWSPS